MKHIQIDNKTNLLSAEISYEAVKELAFDIGNGKIILWQHHGIFLGIIQNGEIIWAKKADIILDDNLKEHFLELRAFSKKKEYRFWINEPFKMKGRLRSGENTVSPEEVDTQMVLRSTIFSQYESQSFKNQNPLVVQIRNYIGYNPATNQAGYIDSRFIEIVSTQDSKHIDTLNETRKEIDSQTEYLETTRPNFFKCLKNKIQKLTDGTR